MGEVKNLRVVEGDGIFSQQQAVLAEALDGSLDIGYPAYTPAATTGTASTGLTVANGVSYKYTYAVLDLRTSAVAAETYPSSASSTASTKVTNGCITLGLTVSSDPLVNARVIYRTNNGSYTNFYLLHILTNNSDTSYIDGQAGISTAVSAVLATTANSSGLKFFGNGQSLTTPVNPLTNDVFSVVSTAAGATTYIPNSTYKWFEVNTIYSAAVGNAQITIDSTARQFWGVTAANQVCKMNFPVLCDSITVPGTGWHISGYMIPKPPDMWPVSYNITSAATAPVTSSSDEVNDRFVMMFANLTTGCAVTSLRLLRRGTEYSLIYPSATFKNSTGTPLISIPITFVPGDSLKVINASTSTFDIWGIKYRLR